MAAIRCCLWCGFCKLFGRVAIGAFKKPLKLYITFSIGFIRYILTDGKWLRSFAHLCLLSLHKVHIPLPQVKAEEHARTVLVTDSLGLLSIIFVH